VAANDAKISIEQIKLDASKKATEILSPPSSAWLVDNVSETTVRYFASI
jgi:hypothetical protein